LINNIQDGKEENGNSKKGFVPAFLLLNPSKTVPTFGTGSEIIKDP
jgi:glutathione S-transferase